MAVCVVAVPGLDRGDLLVARVVDVVGAAGDPAEAGALPEGQDLLAVVCLGAEVRILFPAGAAWDQRTFFPSGLRISAPFW